MKRHSPSLLPKSWVKMLPLSLVLLTPSEWIRVIAKHFPKKGVFLYVEKSFFPIFYCFVTSAKCRGLQVCCNTPRHNLNPWIMKGKMHICFRDDFSKDGGLEMNTKKKESFFFLRVCKIVGFLFLFVLGENSSGLNCAIRLHQKEWQISWMDDWDVSPKRAF